MRQPDPVQVLDLFAPERAALLEVLAGLAPAEWERPTACAGWCVKDVVVHILGGDLANLSRRRDNAPAGAPMPGEDIVAFLNRINEQWVQAARRLSPRMLIDLLGHTGPQLAAYYASLDLDALGGGVSWAGLERAPVWLDVAREYSEHWLHQQHIRDAAGRPGLTDRRFFTPVLATFVYALPHAFRNTAAPDGSPVHLRVAGEAGGDWSIVRVAGNWTLHEGAADNAVARVEMDQAMAWKLFTKGIAPAQAEHASRFAGDKRLGLQVLRAVAIIA